MNAASRQVMKSIPENSVECRTLQHMWRYMKVNKVKGGWEQQLLCLRCDTEKIQRLDRDGIIQSTTYHYKKDQYLVEGLGAMDAKDRGSLRLRAMEIAFRKES